MSFLQWTRTGTSLAGMLTMAYLDNTDHVSTDSGPITGVTNGSSVTLHTSDFKLAADYASTVSGIIRGPSLVLSYPGPNGMLSTQPFHLASVSAYNGAVGDLNRQAAAARQAAAHATAVAVASTCAVFTNTEADIAITVRGSGHWAICGKIVHIGRGLYEVDVGGDFDIHLYALDCTAEYQGDTVSVYDYNGPRGMVARACTDFRRHRLPVLM